jgi:hypothetical protein
MFGPGVDPDKQFKAEAENLAVLAHEYTLAGVEQRLLETVKVWKGGRIGTLYSKSWQLPGSGTTDIVWNVW